MHLTYSSCTAPRIRKEVLVRDVQVCRRPSPTTPPKRPPKPTPPDPLEEGGFRAQRPAGKGSKGDRPGRRVLLGRGRGERVQGGGSGARGDEHFEAEPNKSLCTPPLPSTLPPKGGVYYSISLYIYIYIYVILESFISSQTPIGRRISLPGNHGRIMSRTPFYCSELISALLAST